MCVVPDARVRTAEQLGRVRLGAHPPGAPRSSGASAWSSTADPGFVRLAGSCRPANADGTLGPRLERRAR